ncbi:hypothetical protein R3P38DRAFT_2791530 [Favolaschia claudopus]|uniref:Flavin-containing monooxygenase n=1 Tax=Favolaschia claudopus TaxID=2862362 RepID=A0AAW0AFS0_9AGAR
MLQRSSTCVISVETTARLLSRLWPAHVPTAVADFKAQMMPFLLVKEIGRATTETMWAQEKETHKGLREAGLSLTMGKDGSGQHPMIFERFGDLIRSGKIKIKHGVEIERFTETSAIFTDGSSIALDVVIFATGYRSIRDTLRQIFGDEIIDQTSTVWGVDEEGELNGCYRPSGHPGFWYAAGDFPVSRFYSKQLFYLFPFHSLCLSRKNLARIWKEFLIMSDTVRQEPEGFLRHVGTFPVFLAS